MSISSDRLAQADQRIAEAEQRITHQIELIEALARDGHDTTKAKEILWALIKALEGMYAYRRLILAQIPAELDTPSATRRQWRL